MRIPQATKKALLGASYTPISIMAPNEVFVDACVDEDLKAVEDAIATQTLTAEDLEEGLQCATERRIPTSYQHSSRPVQGLQTLR